MKHILRNCTLVLALCGYLNIDAMAQGIPVFDGTSVANLVSQLKNQATQIQNQVEQLKKAQEQIENMKQRLEAMTGPKGLSSLLNGASNQAQRQAASSLDGILNSAIKGASVGGGNVDRINTTISELKSKFSLDNLADLDASTKPLERAIAQLAGAGIAATATAEDSYVRSNEGTQRVNQLINEIDKTADLKASVDLNTRVLTEISQQLNDLIRLQASLAQAQGNAAIATARDRAAARKFGKVSE